MIVLNLFTTITNANFDKEVFYDRIRMNINVKRDLIDKLDNKEGLLNKALYDAETNEEFDEKSNTVEVEY